MEASVGGADPCGALTLTDLSARVMVMDMESLLLPGACCSAAASLGRTRPADATIGSDCGRSAAVTLRLSLLLRYPPCYPPDAPKARIAAAATVLRVTGTFEGFVFTIVVELAAAWPALRDFMASRSATRSLTGHV